MSTVKYRSCRNTNEVTQTLRMGGLTAHCFVLAVNGRVMRTGRQKCVGQLYFGGLK